MCGVEEQISAFPKYGASLGNDFSVFCPIFRGRRLGPEANDAWESTMTTAAISSDAALGVSMAALFRGLAARAGAQYTGRSFEPQRSAEVA